MPSHFAQGRSGSGGVTLATEQDPEKTNPTYIDVGNKAAEWLAERTHGIAQSMILEAMADIPTTAHILGGSVVSRIFRTFVRRRARVGRRVADRAAAYSCSIWPTRRCRRCNAAAPRPD